MKAKSAPVSSRIARSIRAFTSLLVNARLETRPAAGRRAPFTSPSHCCTGRNIGGRLRAWSSPSGSASTSRPPGAFCRGVHLEIQPPQFLAVALHPHQHAAVAAIPPRQPVVDVAGDDHRDLRHGVRNCRFFRVVDVRQQHHQVGLGRAVPRRICAPSRPPAAAASRPSALGVVRVGRSSVMAPITATRRPFTVRMTYGLGVKSSPARVHQVGRDDGILRRSA